jgi:quercetin dioxygenase-like cupin family protein
VQSLPLFVLPEEQVMPVVKLDDQPEKVLVAGTRVRFVHSASMTLAYWTFEPGAVLPAHAHPHEQVTNVLEGDFEMTVDGQVYRIRPGDVVVIPPNATHSGRAFTLCRFIDVFHPVREDYR